MKFLKLLIALFLVTGCASFGRTMKSLVGGGDSSSSPEEKQQSDSRTLYSQKENAPVKSDKDYHRISKDEFEQDNLMLEKNGSLWVMEGQESYLFSQNIIRLPGDILNINLEGQPYKQLSTKVSVIKQLSDQAVKAARLPASIEKPKDEGAPVQQSTEAPILNGEKIPEGNEKALFDVNEVPVRIVSRTMDGSYRVKGSQSFMIGKDEYRVIVSGLVRPGDVSDRGVASSKMIDSKFDIVRSRKRGL